MHFVNIAAARWILESYHSQNIAVFIPKSHDIVGVDGNVIGKYIGNGFSAMNGKGKVTLSDGTKISGNFRNGCVISDSDYKVQFENCGVYVGTIDEDFHPHGKGVYTNTDGVEIESDLVQ